MRIKTQKLAAFFCCVALGALPIRAQEPLTIPGLVSSGSPPNQPAPADAQPSPLSLFAPSVSPSDDPKGAAPQNNADAEGPLSPVEWLSRAAAEAEAKRQIAPEPAAVANASVPEVEVITLNTPASQILGLIPADVAGLSSTLWLGSQSKDVAGQIADVQIYGAAMTRLAHRILRAETQPPQTGSSSVWLRARAERLLDLGAVAEARALLEQLPEENADNFELWADLALLDGETDAACNRWRIAPWLSDDLVWQVYCKARLQDWNGAVTTLWAAQGLDLLPPQTVDLLWRYLDPELAEGLPPLSITPKADALTFRLLEAIGEPPATATLPRAFDLPQLTGDSGWKAQIEAAERLVRSGALAPEVWIAIVMERAPAASGGVWDRVSAVQTLIRSLTRGTPEVVDAAVWDATALLAPVGLVVPLAEALEPRLPDDSWLRLLGPEFVDASGRLPTGHPVADLVSAVARGDVPPPITQGRYSDAVAIAFTLPGVPPQVAQLQAEDRIGEALLLAMQLIADGASGDDAALTQGLRALRALGFDTDARRAAIELLILGSME